MSKCYIVVRVGWEYNDDFYYRPDDKGGSPVKTFLKDSDAEQYALELTAEQYAGHLYDTSFYGFRPLQFAGANEGEQLSLEIIETLSSRISKVIGEGFEPITRKNYWEWTVPKGLNLEQRIEIARVVTELTENFLFEVIETDLV